MPMYKSIATRAMNNEMEIERQPSKMIGMHDFDLEYLRSLGFERFKLLRPRKGNQTGF